MEVLQINSNYTWKPLNFGGMGSRREDVDLELVLEDPKCAREYIRNFDWGLPDPPKYIVTGLDEKIWFDNMSDRDAVCAAKIILREWEIPMTFKSSKLEFWHH